MNQDFCYVKRLADGKILDIPAKDLETTLRRGGFIKIDDVSKVYENSDIQFPKKQEIFECPLCGTVVKDQKELTKHKKNHQ